MSETEQPHPTAPAPTTTEREGHLLHELPAGLSSTGSTGSTARAVVLVLHGGTQHSTAPVGPRSASWWRARWLQRALTPALAGRGVASALLAYDERGWNGTGLGRTDDARQALRRLRERHGDVPVVLLGHSMGARTAVHVADAPGVRGVVGLAPWLPPGEPLDALVRATRRGGSADAGAGTRRARPVALRVAHGRRDRITSARASRAYVERARAAGVDATFTDRGRAGHYLLTGVDAWHAWARESVLDLLR